MKTRIVLLSGFILVGCAATDKHAEQTEKISPASHDSIQAVSKNFDTPPEPVGGADAIHAALNEPEEVWKENKTGWAVVEATIDPEGRIIATRIVKSSGYTGMDSEAMLAVARVAWKPARKKGKSVMATVRVPVVFEKQ
jgi:TonB family protein